MEALLCSFKFRRTWFLIGFRAFVRVVLSKSPAAVAVLPRVRGVRSFLGLFRTRIWVSWSWLLVLLVWEGSLFIRV